MAKALDPFHPVRATAGASRGKFITLVGGAALTCPVVARAQQPAVPDIVPSTAHSPTERAELQTADIARRLMRRGELHQQAAP